MKDLIEELPGLAKIRAKFIVLLGERQMTIAKHAIAAWDGQTVAEVNGNLEAAQYVLHQIAGSAGSLGLAEFGKVAQACEESIINHLEGPDSDLALCPEAIASHLNRFVAECQLLIDAPA
ncbi:MAG: Hpt domain-containing protein [Sulfitobacter sp.]